MYISAIGGGSGDGSGSGGGDDGGDWGVMGVPKIAKPSPTFGFSIISQFWFQGHLFLRYVLPIVLQPESGVFEALPKGKLADIHLSPGSSPH